MLLTAGLCLVGGDNGVGVVQLPPQQGRAPTVHEPPAREQVPGHLHLDRRHWRGASQQDPHIGLRAIGYQR